MCSSGQIKPPADLLSQDQIVAILVDLELAKAMVAHYTDDEDTARQLLQKNVLLICQSHGIDVDVLQNSYQYYLAHLATMQEIYILVTKQLEKLSKRL